MTYIAVFDIGTTAVKGLLVDEAMNMKETETVALTTFTPKAGRVEQYPTDWWQAVQTIAGQWWKNGINNQDVKAITFTGQMEDVITISKQAKAYPAILYSDTRAAQEAEAIGRMFPELRESTGNHVSPTTPLAKLKWLQQHDNEQYEDASAFVFCSKDAIIHHLTGKTVADVVTASTTGMMDLTKQEWNKDIISTYGLDVEKLPQLMALEAIVGQVTAEASTQTGFAESTIVINGGGDAGATTLGASAIAPDDCYFYMGTTGWLATVAENKTTDHLSENHFNLAYVNQRRISVAPLLNVGNIHQWAVNTYVEDIPERTEDPYETFEKIIAKTTICSGGILFLPYLHGERNPIMDTEAKGAYWGIHPQTGQGEMARATLEGVTFSLKQMLELFTLHNNQTITLIGGGSKSPTWCQMMADIMNHPIRIPKDSEYLPSLGIAATAYQALGWTTTYDTYLEKLKNQQPNQTYKPNKANSKKYQNHYNNYLKLYPTMKQMYQNLEE